MLLWNIFWWWFSMAADYRHEMILNKSGWKNVSRSCCLQDWVWPQTDLEQNVCTQTDIEQVTPWGWKLMKHWSLNFKVTRTIEEQSEDTEKVEWWQSCLHCVIRPGGWHCWNASHSAECICLQGMSLHDSISWSVFVKWNGSLRFLMC